MFSHDYRYKERMGRRSLVLPAMLRSFNPLTRLSLVLSGNAFARRWLDCNASQSRTAADEERETEWRKKLLALLTDVHSIGGISDLSFDVVSSLNAVWAPRSLHPFPF